MGCVVQAEETGSNVHKMAAHWPCWCVYWQTCDVHVTQPPQNGCPKWKAETFTSQRLLHTTETYSSLVQSKCSLRMLSVLNTQWTTHCSPWRRNATHIGRLWRCVSLTPPVQPADLCHQIITVELIKGAAPLMTGHRGQHKVGRWQWTVAQVVHACCVHSEQSSGGIRSGDTV